MRLLQLSVLDSHREIGLFALRLFFGFTLIYGTADNVFQAERMAEFSDFLAANGFPIPLASAYLSAYAQLACGILILLGLLTRWAALIMAVNFVVALAMVHLGLPFSQNIAPLAMLFISIVFLFYGAGPMGMDERLSRVPARAT